MSDPILCPSCKNPINQHTLQGMRLTLDTWCTYRPQDIAAALTSERDRLLEVLKSIEYINIGQTFDLQELDAYKASHKFCPDCGYKEEDGHWEKCEIGSALDKDA